MTHIPSPLQTLSAVVRGTTRRLFQARGWTLAAVALVPLALLTLTVLIVRRHEHVSPVAALSVFHMAFVPYLLPILSLVAAPAGIREDIEQRTLPLYLVRPQPVWMLPVAKGLPWFLWGSLWISLATLFLPVLGLDPIRLPMIMAALAISFWAQLAFLSALSLVFKRGVLWGAIFFFVWDPLVRILPNNLQRLTFLHHIESMVGSRGGGVNATQLLAQEQISTAPWLSALLLLSFGLICWAFCGLKLQSTPYGLAGQESEG